VLRLEKTERSCMRSARTAVRSPAKRGVRSGHAPSRRAADQYKAEGLVAVAPRTGEPVTRDREVDRCASDGPCAIAAAVWRLTEPCA